MTGNTDNKPQGRIAAYSALIESADGLTLGQVCALSGLEPTTVQNWIKRGFVPHPVRKKYYQRHLARILLIAQLRESMQIDRVGELLSYVNGDTDDESDDLLPEEDLYDIFYRICSELDEQIPSPDEVSELVRRAAGDLTGVCADSEKLLHALNVMACTHLSNLYKQKADDLFREYCVHQGE